MNFGLLLPVLGVALFGLAMVYSASWYNSQLFHGTKFHYFNNQLIGFVLGLVGLGIAYTVDYRVYKKWFVWIYGAGILLLALVFIPGIGITRLGASRWIGVGGFTMQPSEIAKFALVIFISSIAVYGKSETQNILSFKKSLIILGAGLLYCVMIFVEPNLSITLVVGATTFVILFLVGAKLKHLGLFILPAIVGLPVMLVAEPYRVRRLLAFVDPWANPKDEGFQLIQSFFGLGNGGFFGVGFGNSTQKHMFLPFAESDFIFTIIGEEFGFIGSVLFIATLGFITWQIFKTGTRCRDRFGKYLCFGVGTVLFIQSAVNLAVVTGTIPPTGVPLPFVSFGGTSLAVCMSAIGIVLNVEKQNRKQSS